MIMGSIYRELDNAPKELIYTKQHLNTPYIEIGAKKPVGSFEAIYIDPNELWFHGFRLAMPGKEKQGKEKRTFFINAPIAIEQLPKSLTEKYEKINFEPADYSLKRHFKYF